MKLIIITLLISFNLFAIDKKAKKYTKNPLKNEKCPTQIKKDNETTLRSLYCMNKSQADSYDDPEFTKCIESGAGVKKIMSICEKKMFWKKSICNEVMKYKKFKSLNDCLIKENYSGIMD